MTTDIIRHGMTGMRQKWDEWHRNDGMRPSLRQPNFHLIQLILMSFVSFWHHPIAVYNGDDSLMTPKWGPRQARSWQLSLKTIGQSKAMIKAKDKNGRFGTEQSSHPPLPPPAPPTTTSPAAAISKWRNSPTNVLPKVGLVQGGESTLQNLTFQYHHQLWKQRGSSKSRLQILHRQHTFQVTIKPNLIRFNVQDYFLQFSQKQAWTSSRGVHI